MQEPVKAPEELPGREAGGGRGKEEGEEPQEHVLQPIPTELNPTANAKTTYSPLPIAPSTDQVYILLTPGAYPTPETPSPKATPFVLPMLQNFRKLVAIAQAFATTSKINGSCSHRMTQRMVRVRVRVWSTWNLAFPQAPPVPTASKGLKNWFGGSTVSPTFCFNFSCFILFYFILIGFL